MKINIDYEGLQAMRNAFVDARIEYIQVVHNNRHSIDLTLGRLSFTEYDTFYGHVLNKRYIKAVELLQHSLDIDLDKATIIFDTLSAILNGVGEL